MSEWQRPQLALVMKKFAGIVRCTLVSPDDGKNGLPGPRPSSFMLDGTREGFRIVFVIRARAEYLVAATGAAMADRAATAHATAASGRSFAPPRRNRIDSPAPRRGSAPASDSAMCVGRSHRQRPAAPTTVIRRPNATPIPRTIDAAI